MIMQIQEQPKLADLENYIPSSKPTLFKRAAHIATEVVMRIIPILLPTIAGAWLVLLKAADMSLSARITIISLSLEGSLLIWMEAYPDLCIFGKDSRLPVVYALAMVCAFASMVRIYLL